MTAPRLELHGVSRRYLAGGEETYALRDISLNIEAGQMVALMGASGSGKSTLLNILGCLDHPSSGTYRIGGTETTALASTQMAALRRDTFGFIFQRYNLLPQLSALANVEIPAIYAGADQEARHQRARGLLTQLGLGNRLQNRPNQLSGGQQQRVSVARALMNGGAIILADEPSGALDRKTGRELMELLLDLNRQGHTLVIATHDAHVASYAQRVIEIEDGRVVEDRASSAAEPTPIALPPTDVEAPTQKAEGGAISTLWSRFLEATRMAFDALLAHRMRTGLTLLGVIIGIVSVIMMVSLGEAAQRIMQKELTGLPANFLFVFPGKDLGDPDAARIRTLTSADADILRQQWFVYSVSPTLNTSASLRLGSLNRAGTVNGVHESHFETMGLPFEIGRSFSSDDTLKQKQVAVIDGSVRRQFFPGDNPIGRIIYVGKLPCIVVGVTGRNIAMESPGEGNRLNVWLPYTTVSARLVGRNYLDNIVLRFRDGAPIDAVVNSIEEILLRRHRIKDFAIFNLEERIRSRRVFTDSMTLLLAAIGIISLTVGGIGVMNIMLVSVSERAKEIGIRMAVGGRRADIQSQFITEAIVICLIGGVAGVFISYGMSYVANSLLPKEWELFLSLRAIGAAVACSTLTGLVFGYVPARNASRLDPVEALARD